MLVGIAMPKHNFTFSREDVLYDARGPLPGQAFGSGLFSPVALSFSGATSAFRENLRNAQRECESLSEMGRKLNIQENYEVWRKDMHYGASWPPPDSAFGTGRFRIVAFSSPGATSTIQENLRDAHTECESLKSLAEEVEHPNES